MKKFFLLCTVLFTFPFMVAAAQSASSDSSSRVAPSFLRLYFAELIMNEARVGLEIGTVPQQSLVIDGSYIWGFPSAQSLASQPGWSIKVDYRFYSVVSDRGTRVFYGPNLMWKQQTYTKETGYGSAAKGQRSVVGLNLKTGIDFQLARTGRSRLEVFTGAGIRYKTVGQKVKSDWADLRSRVERTGPTVKPSLLLGFVLKF